MSLASSAARLAAVLLLSTAAAAAGPIVDRAAEAEAHLAAGRTVQALASVEAAFNEVWDKAPLGFSEALFVTGKPAGFGVYEVRPSNVFRAGEDMLVYAEPFGYGYGREADNFKIAFDADFELRTQKGLILHSQKDFAVLDMASRRRNKEFQIFITYDFEGLKPGDYVLVTTLRDRNSDKRGSFELPFSIAGEPAPQP
jgi:hypothetical protein